MRLIPASTLEPYAVAIITRLGTPPDKAQVVARHIIEAHLAGHDSHGIVRMEQYAAQVEAGTLRPAAEPRIVSESVGTAVIDGGLAWGPIVAQRALDLAIDKGTATGIASVGVRGSSHIGRVGAYALEAAERGWIALLFCNVHGVARVAPWGGREARIATNPIAAAVPCRHRPILLDITTSVVAEGKVRLAHSTGKPIPPGWVLDRDGAPTQDPADLYQGGTLLPLGGREGHKGYALGLFVDLLGGILTGAGAGLLTPALGNGLLVVVIDPQVFGPREAFLDRVAEYEAYIRSSAPAAGSPGILLPGEPEARTAEERRLHGIPIDGGLWAKVGALARKLGVEPPEV